MDQRGVDIPVALVPEASALRDRLENHMELMGVHTWRRENSDGGHLTPFYARVANVAPAASTIVFGCTSYANGIPQMHMYVRAKAFCT